jgi:enoyl-CoA hydratase
VGVFPFMISALIYRNIDRMKANELMMLGELVTASEAASIGFVNRVVDDAEFDSEVLRWATTIASKSPLLMRLGKQSINATRDMPLGEALSTLQAQLALAFATDDMREGVAAFREKRDPVWTLR